MNLLIELTGHQRHSQSCDADTQTTSLSPHRESLVEKMKVIDEEYEALRYKGDRWMSSEAKLAEYRKEIEAQVQAEMKTQLQHYKDVEIAKVKTEEREKSRKESQELRRELERMHGMKAEALITREKNAIERLQKQQEIEEKEMYTQRQSVLKEIDTVRSREAELRQRVEAFEMSCKVQDEKSKVMEELLRRRELAVKTMEDTYDQKLKTELTRYQLELKEEYLKRTEQLTENEKRNKEESVRLQKELADVDARLEEHKRTGAELRRLQAELDTAQSHVSLLAQQNALLKERLESVSDYGALRRDKVELQAQSRLLKKQLEEVLEEYHVLRADCSRPSKEQLALQSELKRLESDRTMDREVFDTERLGLQAQLHKEVTLSGQLKAQLLECEERMRRMSSHAEDLKVQLRQTEQALENEVLRNPKPSLVDRSVLELSADGVVPPDIYVDAALPWARGGYNDMRAAGASPFGRGHQWARSSSPDTDLVAEAKARIRELEKEAEDLEEAYRHYQHRAAHAAVTRTPSPRPSRTPPASYHHVTFAPAEPAYPFAGPVTSRSYLPPEFNGAQSPGERTPEDQSSIPLRRLSSTPLSISRRPLQREEVCPDDPLWSSEGDPLPETFPGVSPERQLSPIPRREVSSSGNFPPDITSLSSPPLKSTAREQRSPQKLPQALSSSESSPQPEKITLEDLTEPSREPSHIPELLQDTDSPPSGETPAPPGETVIPSQALTPPLVLAPPLALVLHEHPTDREREEEEEERKEREERSEREREQHDLERLEQQRLLEESRHTDQAEVGEEREEGERLGGPSPEGRGDQKKEVPEASAADPLQLYMRMVMEGGDSGHEQNPKKETETKSLQADMMLDEKDDSIVAFSHEDVDEDFW